MKRCKCFLPTCPNSESNTPNKVFVHINNHLKRKWCDQLNIDYKSDRRFYCCEDHLNLKEDLVNYYQWKFMKSSPRLKSTAVLRIKHPVEVIPTSVATSRGQSTERSTLVNNMDNNCSSTSSCAGLVQVKKSLSVHEPESGMVISDVWSEQASVKSEPDDEDHATSTSEIWNPGTGFNSEDEQQTAVEVKAEPSLDPLFLAATQGDAPETTSVLTLADFNVDKEELDSDVEDNFDSGGEWLVDLAPGRVEAEPRSRSTSASEDFCDPRDSDVTRAAGSKHIGSDYDSDESDLDVIADDTGMRNIPDDDLLDDPVRDIVNAIQDAMDEALDRLNGMSSDFNWQEDFATFRGIPEVFSGPTPGPVKDYDTPYDAFIDIWDRDIMERIVRETNRYAKQTIEAHTAAGILKPTSRLRRWVDTDVDEMYVFFATYIFMGVDRRASHHEYWASGIMEMPKFRQMMPYNRFILLNTFVHFVNNQDCPQSAEMSAKLNKLAPVLDHLNSKFQRLYNLDKNLAIDESLTVFDSRLSWVYGIWSKAARFGIRSLELCESRTGYLSKFEIYAGKNSEGDVPASSADLGNKSTLAVLDLLESLKHRGHCITMDNYYNSPSLARYLKSFGFDCFGTLRVNRKHVPEAIAKASDTEASEDVPKGTIVARHSGDVSCIAWNDVRMVNMISTFHNVETFPGSKEPVVVRDYNKTMGDLDLKDRKLSMFLPERKRRVKWYMEMFKRLLNVSVHNALILLLMSLKRRDKPELSHRDFRIWLADSLVEKHCRSAPQELSATAEEMRLSRDLIHVPGKLDRTSRMYCHMCRRRGVSQKVRTKCVTCDEAMCVGACWADWHTLQQLPGNVQVRRGRRRAALANT